MKRILLNFFVILVCLIISCSVLLGCYNPDNSDPGKDDDQADTINSDGFDGSLCSFYDTFDGDSVDKSKWDFQNGDGTEYGISGWGNHEQQYYREENASVSDGLLTINAAREDYGGKRYTSAKLVTKNRFSQLYGRFEAKIRLTKALQGLWPAFWMMPAKSTYGGWPRSGEIDIMEIKGRIPTGASSAIHFGGGSSGHQYLYKDYVYPDDGAITDFHLYSLDWTPETISFSIDGEVYHTRKNTQWYTNPNNGSTAGVSAPFDHEFFIILNLAVGGDFDGGRTPPDSQMPAALEIEFVRVYTLENAPDLEETEEV